MTYRDLQLMNDGFRNLGLVMRQWKKDRMFNDMMNEIDPPRAGTADGRIPTEKPHRGGELEFQMFKTQRDWERQAKQDELHEAYKRAQMQRALREPAARAGRQYVDTPLGQMTAAEWGNYQLGQQREERLRSGGFGAGGSGGTSLADKDRRAIESELRKDLAEHAGVTLEDVPNITGQRLFDEYGEPDPNGTVFEGELHGRKFRMPKAQADRIINRFNALSRFKEAMRPTNGANAATAVPRPQVDMKAPQPDPEREPVQVNSKAERDALPSGTRYVSPDGVVRVKR